MSSAADQTRQDATPEAPAREVSLLDQIISQHNNQTTVTPCLALDHGTKTHRLLLGHGVPEIEWVASELRRWLAL